MTSHEESDAELPQADSSPPIPATTSDSVEEPHSGSNDPNHVSLSVVGEDRDGQEDTNQLEAATVEENEGLSPVAEPSKGEPDAQTADKPDRRAVAAALEDPFDDSESMSGLEYDLSYDIKFSDGVNDMRSAKPGSRVRNRQALSYFLSVEARIKELEEQLETLRNTVKGRTSEQKLSDSDSDSDEKQLEKDSKLGEKKAEKWRLDPAWKGLRDFVDSIDNPAHPTPIIEILTEPMQSALPVSEKGKERRHQAKAEAQPAPQHGGEYEIHRIRINSPYVCDAFATVAMKKSRAPKPGQTHIRPFKAILAYHADLKRHLGELDQELEASTNQAKPSELEARLGEQSNEDARSVVADSSEELSNEEDRIVNTVKHLRSYLDFVDKHLATDLASYQALRSRSPSEDVPKVSFADLWKIYAPGDILYKPDVRQACRVSAVRNGRKTLRWRKRDDAGLDKGEGAISNFVITALNLDFDGALFGPVQFDIVIEPYEGLRAIVRLPAHHIEFAEPLSRMSSAIWPELPSKTVRDAVIERGKRFAALAKPMKVLHKDYEGLTWDSVQEHIDSEIIIDIEKYYRSEPERKPPFSNSISDTEPGNIRETSESVYGSCPCSDESCTLGEYDSRLYDDRNVDDERAEKALGEIVDIQRWRDSGQDVLSKKYPILLPYKIHGFVLKSREWHALDIDMITEIQHDKQNFDDLILQPGHKDIVKSLVDMHSGGPKKVEGSTAPKEKFSAHQRADLVRGKGKGLIILLHGVPGVGKTSTAECVAEHTGRPLYSLTCGDIGETPNEVQTNLQKAFSLAYRWGCVLLLDEADVFLAERSRTDMKRNAVVSIFLRTLEYYSGILFLTTNKVGVFDDAFKSRIHVSLYYKTLDFSQSVQIWKVNLKRIKELNPELVFDENRILAWVEDSLSDNERIPWNGRQIHNAVRTAAALAAFNPENKNRLKVSHFKKVEKASMEFDKYLEDTRGQDELSIAATMGERADPRKADLYQQTPTSSRNPRSRPSYDGNNRLLAGLELSSAGRSRASAAQQPARQARSARNAVYSNDDELEDELPTVRKRQAYTNGGAEEDHDSEDE